MRQPWLDDTLAANGRPILENFADWFGNSQIVNNKGEPLMMHHATYRDFDAFEIAPSDWTKRKMHQAHYFTSNPVAAASFAGGYGSRMVPVYVSAQNPFDHENPVHLKLLSDHVSDLIEYAEGSWATMEQHRVMKGIRKAGFDAMFVQDETGKSLAVFDSSQVKSAIGNSGLYLKAANLTDTQAALDLIRAIKARQAIASQARKGVHHAHALA